MLTSSCVQSVSPSALRWHSSIEASSPSQSRLSIQMRKLDGAGPNRPSEMNWGNATPLKECQDKSEFNQRLQNEISSGVVSVRTRIPAFCRLLQHLGCRTRPGRSSPTIPDTAPRYGHRERRLTRPAPDGCPAVPGLQ